MKKETWKAVVDYEGLYEVSDLGRVRSLDREVTYPSGTRKIKGRVLKPAINIQKRVVVALCNSEGHKTYRIHNLVARAFIGEKPNGYDVCHKDGDSTNNKLSNLRYDTRQQNNIDVYRYGSKVTVGKLSIEQVLEIRKLYATGNYSQRKLAKMFPVNQSSIGGIVRREKFSWLNDDGTIDDSKTEIKHIG